ncbi:YoaK family protein [Paenibacillus sp. UMB7766-LJ446]|uniref:YoaK family protein n=1 Tax=Paenibacillus sp. UMB7766-LJ446 TaxID=3046313 RepID=UPI00254EDBA7|nr:YoaK family protein [Paenibacillus sp. UMB7766-LJ446]MDK8190753.1 YoaK family protein [Paenibacillus sp. UMB7766-LJ446]
MNQNTLQKYAMLLLCLSAGMVDVIGYLGLGHVLTANMTGNIVLLGIAIARAQEFVVLRALLALIGFIAGNAIAAHMIGRVQTKNGWSSRVTTVFTVESILLLLFAITMISPYSEQLSYMLIAILAAAMGMQTTAARRIGIAGISTTVLTNNLAAVVEDAVSILQRLRHANIRSLVKALSADAYLRAGAVVIYLCGVILAAILFHHVPMTAVWIPVLIVGGVTLYARLYSRRTAKTATDDMQS